MSPLFAVTHLISDIINDLYDEHMYICAANLDKMKQARGKKE
jgi:hypothetical protein